MRGEEQTVNSEFVTSFLSLFQLSSLISHLSLTHLSSSRISPYGKTTMKIAFVASFFGALCAQNAAAFSPTSRGNVLKNLKEMSMEVKMTGAGGAAQPDNYVEGECDTHVEPWCTVHWSSSSSFFFPFAMEVLVFYL